MADILLDEQGTPTTPSSGTGIYYIDSGTSLATFKGDAGKCFTLGLNNYNTSDVTANAADTYISGSNIAVPQHLLQTGTMFLWKFWMTKTAAGTATPVWNVRVGTNGTTADTARLTFTGPAQTAAADTGTVEIMAVLRNIGAAGVLAGGLTLVHNLSTTGFANTQSPTIQVTSSGFDTTVANTIVGVSVDPGASGVWTHQVITVQVQNL